MHAQDGDEGTRARLADAVFNIGMFAIDTPGSKQPFMGALQTYVECLETDGEVHDMVLKTSMDDATERLTLATSTNVSLPEPLPAAAATSCPRFADASARLRGTVDAAGVAYASLLDELVHGPAVQRGDVDLYRSAVARGESLEHFHVFRRDGPPDDDLATLSMHTDVGLFIVMTAPEYFSEPGAVRLEPGAGKPGTGFILELPSGELVRPVVPDGALLVLNGEGATKWMRLAGGSRHPRPASHEVTVPDISGMARAWFGRMYFPPRDALLQGSDTPVTWGEYRQQTYSAFRGGQKESASLVGCTPSRSLLQDEGSCNDDEVYCWMVRKGKGMGRPGPTGLQMLGRAVG
eukprot:365809-Chlamydomonas_euryale.AAC.8